MVRDPGKLLAGAVLALGVLGGCISGLGGDPVTIRYFSPERGGDGAGTDAAVIEAGAGAHALRLRRIVAAGHLRERIVWRSSSVEYGYYELGRWTDLPQAYLRRDLSVELFERRGVLRSDSLDVPILDVELRVFEEYLDPHEAVVEVMLRLSDADGVAILQRSVRSAEPVDGRDAADFAAAMAHAHAAAVVKTADAVLDALGRAPAAGG